MSYTAKQSASFLHECHCVLDDLQSLMLECTVQGQELTNKHSREHLLYGAGRRILVLERSIENIFRTFPPSLDHLLKRDARMDVEINLHAFMTNLCGVFDNWAWAFVLRHDLDKEFKNRQEISLFKNKTQKFLPTVLKEYLLSEKIKKWHIQYLKKYRDTLAHRIPLYLPPAVYTSEEWGVYNRLETEKRECLKSKQLTRHEEVTATQESIGKPCFTFLTAFTEEEALDHVYLHPQLLCDSKVVVEFGAKYLGAWHERT